MLKEANPVAFLAYFDALYGNLVSRLDMIRLIYGPSNFTQGKIVLHVRMQNDLYKLTHKFLHQSDLLLC